MNLVVRVANNGSKLIHGLAKHVHHAAKCGATDGNFNPFSKIVGLHSANHAFDGFHRDGPDASFTEVLLHLSRYVQRRGKVVAFAGNAASVVDRRKMSR